MILGLSEITRRGEKTIYELEIRVMYIFSAENSYFLQVEPTWNKRDHCDFFFGVMGLNVIFLKCWKMNASFGKITYRKKLIVDFIKYYLTRRSIWLNSQAKQQMVSISRGFRQNSLSFRQLSSRYKPIACIFWWSIVKSWKCYFICFKVCLFLIHH